MEKRQLRERPPPQASATSSMSRSTSSRAPSLSKSAADNGVSSSGGDKSSFAVSSSSRETSSSDSRKRTREVADDEGFGVGGKNNSDARQDENVDIDGTTVRQLFGAEREPADMGQWAAFTVTAHEASKWEKLSEDTKQRCINIVCRLLLFKGSHREPVSRKHVIDALKLGGEEYSQYAGAVLKEAQKLLENSFGFQVIDGGQIPGVASEKAAEATKYYVINGLRSSQVRILLSQHDLDVQYRGLLFVVLHTVWASPGRRVGADNVLKRLRQIDDSIPENSKYNSKSRSQQSRNNRGNSSIIISSKNNRKRSKSTDGDASSDSEGANNNNDSNNNNDHNNGKGSGDESDEDGYSPSRRKRAAVTDRARRIKSDVDFDKTLSRMIKDAYLVRVDREPGEEPLFTFGPRFFAEIGLKRLVKSYFDARGIRADVSLMKDVDREESRLFAEVSKK